MCLLWGEEKYAFYNDAFLPILGRRHHPYAFGRPGQEIWPEHWLMIENQLQGVSRCSDPNWNEDWKTPVYRDGRTLDAYFSYGYSPVMSEEGREQGMLISAMETTARVAAERALLQSNERLDLALETAKLGVWHLNIKNRTVVLSPRLSQAAESTSRDSLANFVNKFMHPEDAPDFLRRLESSIEQHAPLECQLRLLRNNGEYRWHHTRAEYFCDAAGDGTVLTGVLQDIHEQKILELQLTESLRVRDEFLSIASHELRTPLTSLNLQTQTIARQLRRGDPRILQPETIMKLTDNASRQIKQLTHLIDDMLDVSRIGAGKLSISFEDIDLTELTTQALYGLTDQLENAKVTVNFTYEEGVIVRGDFFRLEQTITNLITNAIKYGQRKPVRFHVGSRGAMARIEVQDQGIGIDPENQSRIFERFERAISASNVSGLGLGLYITRQIIEAHGGKIWVESCPGQGSLFVAEIPLLEKW